jgi:hypothetical protein
MRSKTIHECIEALLEAQMHQVHKTVRHTYTAWPRKPTKEDPNPIELRVISPHKSYAHKLLKTTPDVRSAKRAAKQHAAAYNRKHGEIPVGSISHMSMLTRRPPKWSSFPSYDSDDDV